MSVSWQEQMDAAFDRYFAMSKLLQSDIEALFEDGSRAQRTRRNFIRAASALVEGYTHCFREMCQVGIATGPGPLSVDEMKALTAERGFGSIERTKFTICATYKLFQLPDVPDFSVRGWQQAQMLFDKRDRLMHPKSVEDLNVPDDEWDTIYDGITWVFAQLFDFMAQLARVHGISPAAQADP